MPLLIQVVAGIVSSSCSATRLLSFFKYFSCAASPQMCQVSEPIFHPGSSGAASPHCLALLPLPTLPEGTSISNGGRLQAFQLLCFLKSPSRRPPGFPVRAILQAPPPHARHRWALQVSDLQEGLQARALPQAALAHPLRSGAALSVRACEMLARSVKLSLGFFLSFR